MKLEMIRKMDNEYDGNIGFIILKMDEKKFMDKTNVIINKIVQSKNMQTYDVLKLMEKAFDDKEIMIMALSNFLQNVGIRMNQIRQMKQSVKDLKNMGIELDN